MEIMLPLKARVKGGRLVLDEPTDLPEGETVCLVPVGDEEDLDAEERARLDEALELSMAEARAGRVVPASDVLRKLTSGK